VQVAISYIRFSSAQQSEGDSLRRQLEMTRTYATKQSLLLDESLTYRDLGVSGWKGKHRTEGMLKALLDGIKFGRVRRGTALLVERLDRLTREGFMTGVSLMMDILKAGIEVHSVASGRIFPGCFREREEIGTSYVCLGK
jgi:DNA invertase Pin-like site-specific DNA recombinase